MSPTRWRDQMLPGRLGRVLQSAREDDQQAQTQHDALAQRLVALGVLPGSAVSTPGAQQSAAQAGDALRGPELSGGKASIALGHSGTAVPSAVSHAARLGSQSAHAGARLSSALGQGTAGGSLALSGKAWLCMLALGAASGVGAYRIASTSLFAAPKKPPALSHGTEPAATPKSPAQGQARLRDHASSPQVIAALSDAAEKGTDAQVSPGVRAAGSIATAPAKEPTARPLARNAAARPRAKETAAGRLREEVALLDAMRAALPTAPARALRYAALHAQRFASGPLASERELLRVEALLASHRTQEALAVAAQLQRDFPDSAYARRAQRQLTRASVEIKKP